MNSCLSPVYLIIAYLHINFRVISSFSAAAMTSKHLTTGSTDPPLVPGKLRLYSMRFCPYSHRAHLTLLAKQIPFDPVFINLKTKPEWYNDRVPTGKVPALLVDGENVYESLIIADFLDEKYSERPLHNKDPLHKAKDRILIENFSKVTSKFYKVMVGTDASEEQLGVVVQELEHFDKELTSKNTTFFGGDKPGMVDYMIWPWFERFLMFKVLYGDKFAFPEQKLPKLAKWLEAMKTVEAVKQYYLAPEDHARFIRTHQAGNPDYDILTHT